MKTKKYDMKKRGKWMLPIGTLILILGIALMLTKPEIKLGELMVTNTLITMGLTLLAIGILNIFIRKEIKYDERDQLIVLKSSKIVLSIIIYASIIGMFLGTIQKISIDLLTASIIILLGTIIIYRISHYYLNKKN
jgi:hypothetical protein